MNGFDYQYIGIIALATVVIFVALRFFLLRWEKKHHKSTYVRQLWLGLVVFLGIVLIVIFFPVNEEDQTLKKEVISIIGIVISGAIALSSTTFLGNAFAGLMNRITDNYQLGNFLMVKGYFGRVTNRSVFHVEIQTPERNLISIPNLFMSSNPVEIYRSSGTLITTSVSLGYEVPRQKVEPLLVEAAVQAGLEEPFVYITSLGDFSVVYKVHGLLKEVSKLISVRSRLHAMILDRMHENQIEIVSPTFMNQRQVNEVTFIPKDTGESKQVETIIPEELMFDKAERASNLENLKQRQKELTEKMNSTEERIRETEDEETQKRLKNTLASLKNYHERLGTLIDEANDSLKEEE